MNRRHGAITMLTKITRKSTFVFFVSFVELSAAFHKYGDAPRAARRPAARARRPIIRVLFVGAPTPAAGMHRRPNATVFMKVST
jgi:hypothetical protein